MNVAGATRHTLRGSALLHLVSTAETTVTISSGSRDTVLQVPAGSPRSVELLDLAAPDLDLFARLDSASNDVPWRIRSSRPIYAICELTTRFGSEMFALRPIEAWSSDYSVVSHRQSTVYDVFSDTLNEETLDLRWVTAQVVILSGDQPVNVTLLTPDGNIPLVTLSLQPFQYRLIRGAFPASNLDTTSLDPTGLKLRGDAPFGVLSGHTRWSGDSVLTARAPTGNSGANLLIEQLSGASGTGTDFLYTPLLADSVLVPETITLLSPSEITYDLVMPVTGATYSSDPAGVLRLSTDQLTGDELSRRPLRLATTAPVEAFVTSGSYAIGSGGGSSTTDHVAESWAPALLRLPPLREWYHWTIVPVSGYPTGVSSTVIISAEASATVIAGDRAVSFDTLTGGAIKVARLHVAEDLPLLATGGRMAATFYSNTRGVEAFRPLGVDLKKGREPLHIAEYEEYLSASKAAAIPGFDLSELPPVESLLFDQVQGCDSVASIVTIDGDRWTSAPLSVQPVETVNAAVVIDRIPAGSPPDSVVVILRPIQSDLDASAVLEYRSGATVWLDTLKLPAVAVSAQHTSDLGNTLTPGESVSLTVQLANAGSADAVVGEISAVGTLVEVEQIEPIQPIVPSGASTVVTVSIRILAASGEVQDTLRLITACDTLLLPIHGRVEPIAPPLPIITGYDWRRRLIGGTYDTVVTIRNSGRTEFVVAAVITGSATGPFSVLSDQAGAVLQPGEVRDVPVRFAPTVIGAFSEPIVLRTVGGLSDTALLVGESAYPQRDSLDLEGSDPDELCVGEPGSLEFLLVNGSSQGIQIDALTLIRSSNLTATSFLPSSGFPIRIGPGDTLRGSLLATPPSAGAYDALLAVEISGLSEGLTLLIEGNAVLCEREAAVNDVDFGTLLKSMWRDSVICITNSGESSVEVRDVGLILNPDGVFNLSLPPLPFILSPGESRCLSVRFTAADSIAYLGQVLWETNAGDLVSTLLGAGRVIYVPALIRRDYHGLPGTEIDIGIEIVTVPELIEVDSLDLDLFFDPDLLTSLGLSTDSPGTSPLLGIGVLQTTVPLSDGRIAPGRLASVRFLIRLSLQEFSELPFTISTDLPYVVFREQPGLFVADPFCAEEQRLFEFSEFGVEIGRPEPNPADAETLFRFEIPFENPTRISLYDLSGNEVLRPLEETLTAGIWQIRIPTAGLATGTYVLRFWSGELTATRRLEVRH